MLAILYAILVIYLWKKAESAMGWYEDNDKALLTVLGLLGTFFYTLLSIFVFGYFLVRYHSMDQTKIPTTTQTFNIILWQTLITAAYCYPLWKAQAKVLYQKSVNALSKLA